MRASRSCSVASRLVSAHHTCNVDTVDSARPQITDAAGPSSYRHGRGARRTARTIGLYPAGSAHVSRSLSHLVWLSFAVYPCVPRLRAACGCLQLVGMGLLEQEEHGDSVRPAHRTSALPFKTYIFPRSGFAAALLQVVNRFDLRPPEVATAWIVRGQVRRGLRSSRLHASIARSLRILPGGFQ